MIMKTETTLFNLKWGFYERKTRRDIESIA